MANAIYFKGLWKDQFQKNVTRDENFTLSNGQVIRTPMMTNTSGDVFYAETEELQILEMPYEGDDISMLILLPKGNNLSALEESFTIENLNRWRSLLRNREVQIYFPRFTFKTKYSLVDRLKMMGMPSAFASSLADFSGITGKKDLSIDQVLHQAFVDVNEEGTEAAAATAIEFEATSAPPPPPVFRADHPFIFIIQKKEKEFVNGHILFLGRLNDPTK